MIDLLLVIIILVLLGIAAPIIRGDFQGKLLLQYIFDTFNVDRKCQL